MIELFYEVNVKFESKQLEDLNSIIKDLATTYESNLCDIGKLKLRENY